MQRCIKCILPDSYPKIIFNNEGVCSRCIAYEESEERKYLGNDALRWEIDSFLQEARDRNQEYDCVLGLSGGRDSSYLLYYLVRQLKLRVIAYCADNGFIPEETKINMKKATEILGVRLVIEEHAHLRRCIKHTISSWMHQPSLAMIELFCTGCRLDMNKGILDFAERNKIPIVMMGGTPFEAVPYREHIMDISPFAGKFSAILGYFFRVSKNPRWITNYNYLVTQIKEYVYHFHKQRIASRSGIRIISPFWNYIKWREKEVVSTIENKLDWRKNPDVESTWRGDCDIALLKLYLYKQVLGFNDKDESLSHLIRDNQITREVALGRLDKEGELPEKLIEATITNLGFDYSDFRNCVVRFVKDQNR